VNTSLLVSARHIAGGNSWKRYIHVAPSVTQAWHLGLPFMLVCKKPRRFHRLQHGTEVCGKICYSLFEIAVLWGKSYFRWSRAAARVYTDNNNYERVLRKHSS